MSEKTSKEAASAASRVLRDPNASEDAKSAAGSALTQRETDIERDEFRALVESLPGAEQERQTFEAWATDKYNLNHIDGAYTSLRTQEVWYVWREARAALQSQPTEAFPCRIIEADFETGTVTVEMQGKYTVSAGQKYLCDAPLQSQDREDAERYRWILANYAIGDGYDAIDEALNNGEADTQLSPAIDHARRIEGEL